MRPALPHHLAQRLLLLSAQHLHLGLGYVLKAAAHVSAGCSAHAFNTEQQRYRANTTDKQHGSCFGMKWQCLASVKRLRLRRQVIAAALGSNAQGRNGAAETENLL